MIATHPLYLFMHAALFRAVFILLLWPTGMCDVKLDVDDKFICSNLNNVLVMYELYLIVLLLPV